MAIFAPTDMNCCSRYIFGLALAVGLAFLLSTAPTKVEAKDFVVVIDAGHGGHDPGAVGKLTKEKVINLNVALKLGRQIEQNCKDVKVIYTRKTDVFIPLQQRAQIANNAKADLFISIHTNALAKNKIMKGASTWTLGLAKSEANLEVAKRENGVILYEDDYKTRYAGFDPNSSESYIIFELMQDTHMAQSVHLASLVQQEMKQTCRRLDQGVHQAGFLVLKETAMPSILIELGFISTPEEERYLHTDEGTTNLANGIYRAFLAYKNEQQARDGQATDTTPSATDPAATAGSATQPATGGGVAASGTATPGGSQATPSTSSSQEGLVFKVQVLTSSRKLRLDDAKLKGVTGLSYYEEDGLYKYTSEAYTDYNKALQAKRKLAQKFSDAFIVAFRNGQKVKTADAIRQWQAARKQ